MKKSKTMKCLTAMLVIALLACVAIIATACGDENKPDDNAAYTAVAGEWLGGESFTYTSGAMQETVVWDTALTLKADKTFTYKIAATDTIYGSLTYGKFDVTVGGTYTSTLKSDGVYAIVLSEATSLTGNSQLVKDPVSDRSLLDYALTLDIVKEIELSYIYGTRTFDLDTTKEKDSYESFTDSNFADVKLLSAIETLRRKAGLASPTNPS